MWGRGRSSRLYRGGCDARLAESEGLAVRERERETFVNTGTAVLYRVTSLTRRRTPLGPYSRPVHGPTLVLGGGGLLVSEGGKPC